MDKGMNRAELAEASLVAEIHEEHIPMAGVKLRNGTVEPLAIVQVIYGSLRRMFEDGIGGALLAYELAMKCRDPNHQIFGSMGKKLQDLALIDANGRVNSQIKNVVLSAMKGDGLDMELVNPVAEV